MTEKRFLVICDGFGEDSDVLIKEDIDEWRYALTPIYEKGAYNKAGIDKIINRLNELYDENQRLIGKLNQTALELVDEVISQGKAVEISEMSYNEFLDYRAKNGKPMELQL